jgi:diguanylate cyclase (GGDEF)-like protein
MKQYRNLKEIFLLVVITSCIITISPFFFLDFFRKDYTQLAITSIALIGLFFLFMRVFKTGETIIHGRVLALFMLPIVLTMIYIKGSQSIYWLYPLIVATYYLLPSITAGVLNTLVSLTALLLTYTEFSEYSLMRLFFSLTITNMFSLFFSKYVEMQNSSLLDINKSAKRRNDILELTLKEGDLNLILSKIALSIEKEISKTYCSILLVDNSGKHLMLGASPSLPKFYNDAVDGVIIGEGIGSCGHAAFTKKRTTISNITTHPYWAQWSNVTKKVGIKACWSEPIIDTENTVIGTFAIYRKEISSPTINEYSLIDEFTNLARIAIERKKSDLTIWRQANYDSLTNLPNRDVFHKQINTLIDNHQNLAENFSITLLDLDNFKSINDNYGHEGGDFVLHTTSVRINKLLRENDCLFRLGGDEFVIIISNPRSIFELYDLSNKILRTLAEPINFEGEVIFATASIGVETYSNRTPSPKDLLRNADQALYKAKHNGRNQVCFFNQEMAAEFLKRKVMIDDLQNAVLNNDFFICYQPIVDLNSNGITKAEALIRWKHPTKGIIPPDDFIPLAEETGLIVDISNWVFQEVLNKILDWKAKFGSIMQIKVNTSPLLYLNNGALLESWVNLLKQHDIPPSAIGIEITENILMDNLEEVSNVIDFLRTEEIQISIDDFGTGYSSFSYLKEFNIDYIKIDKSFVQGISDTTNDIALCAAILEMAKKLNILVIAEGIETKDQLDKLKSFGCEYGQGYYFHKPLPVEDFEELLAS